MRKLFRKSILMCSDRGMRFFLSPFPDGRRTSSPSKWSVSTTTNIPLSKMDGSRGSKS